MCHEAIRENLVLGVEKWEIEATNLKLFDRLIHLLKSILEYKFSELFLEMS